MDHSLKGFSDSLEYNTLEILFSLLAGCSFKLYHNNIGNLDTDEGVFVKLS